MTAQPNANWVTKSAAFSQIFARPHNLRQGRVGEIPTAAPVTQGASTRCLLE